MDGSYRPDELFDESGAPVPELLALPPSGDRRMSANPVANGGLVIRDLDLPNFRDYAVDVPRPGAGSHEATRVLGSWVRDVIAANRGNFLLFGRDEVASIASLNYLLTSHVWRQDHNGTTTRAPGFSTWL